MSTDSPHQSDQVGKQYWVDQLFIKGEWDVYISTQQIEVILTSFIQRTITAKTSNLRKLSTLQIIQMLSIASQKSQEGCVSTWPEE